VMVVTTSIPTSRSCARWARAPSSIMRSSWCQGAVIGHHRDAARSRPGIFSRSRRRRRARGRARGSTSRSSRARCYIHQRAALRSALARRWSVALVSLSSLRRDDLSQLARIAGESRRGAAL
jgi:hypothetical protein